MIRPDFAKWGQTAEDVRRLSLEAAHVRSRERFQALYVIGTHQQNASEWAQVIGRQDQTVHGWVHCYNAFGPESLHYRRTGGKRPLFRPSSRRASS